MTIDHRTIPGIEFVSCPGPLRVGDYWRGAYSGTLFRVTMKTNGSNFPERVIPHVRPLEVPEETTIASLDELEVCTVLTEPPWDMCWFVDVSTYVDEHGSVRVYNGESEFTANLVERINDLARASRGAK